MARRPPRFHNFSGQRKVVRYLAELVAGSKQEGEACPALLFVGPPGHGKTSLAEAFATEYGSQCHKILASPGLRPEDMLDIVARLDMGDVLFIDEAHNLRPETQEALYGPVDEAKAVTPGRGKGDQPTVISVAGFTLIVATNKPSGLKAAFRDRLVRIEFEPYSLAELKEIAQVVAGQKGLTLTGQAARRLAEMPRNSPRHINKLLTELKQHFPGLRDLGQREVEELFGRKGLDGRWLSPHQRQYLRALLDSPGAACSLTRLASVLQSDPKSIAEDLEPLLFHQGLIEVAAGLGRKLTAEGQKAAAEGAVQAAADEHGSSEEEVG